MKSSMEPGGGGGVGQPLPETKAISPINLQIPKTTTTSQVESVASEEPYTVIALKICSLLFMLVLSALALLLAVSFAFLTRPQVFTTNRLFYFYYYYHSLIIFLILLWCVCFVCPKYDAINNHTTIGLLLIHIIAADLLLLTHCTLVEFNYKIVTKSKSISVCVSTRPT